MKAQLQYDIKDVVSLEDLNSSTRLSLVTGHPLPNWLLRQIRGCNYSAGLLMMICEGECCDSVPVGDPSKESALYVSLPLRQAFYSLLELHPFVFEEMFDRFEMVDVQVYTRVRNCMRRRGYYPGCIGRFGFKKEKETFILLSSLKW